MRLGELRTRTRELENKYIVKCAKYTNRGVEYYDVEIDILTDDELYLRLIEEEE